LHSPRAHRRGQGCRRVETLGREQALSGAEHARIDRPCRRPETVAERPGEALVASAIVEDWSTVVSLFIPQVAAGEIGVQKLIEGGIRNCVWVWYLMSR
jgi:hypothetical protein